MENIAFPKLILIVVILVIPLIALVDILKSRFKESSNKKLWALIVILLPVIGSFLYFMKGSDQKLKD